MAERQSQKQNQVSTNPEEVSPPPSSPPPSFTAWFLQSCSNAFNMVRGKAVPAKKDVSTAETITDGSLFDKKTPADHQAEIQMEKEELKQKEELENAAANGQTPPEPPQDTRTNQQIINDTISEERQGKNRDAMRMECGLHANRGDEHLNQDEFDTTDSMLASDDDFLIASDGSDGSDYGSNEDGSDGSDYGSNEDESNEDESNEDSDNGGDSDQAHENSERDDEASSDGTYSYDGNDSDDSSFSYSYASDLEEHIMKTLLPDGRLQLITSWNGQGLRVKCKPHVLLWKVFALIYKHMQTYDDNPDKLPPQEDVQFFFGKKLLSEGCTVLESGLVHLSEISVTPTSPSASPTTVAPTSRAPTTGLPTVTPGSPTTGAPTTGLSPVTPGSPSASPTTVAPTSGAPTTGLPIVTPGSRTPAVTGTNNDDSTLTPPPNNGTTDSSAALAKAAMVMGMKECSGCNNLFPSFDFEFHIPNCPKKPSPPPPAPVAQGTNSTNDEEKEMPTAATVNQTTNGDTNSTNDKEKEMPTAAAVNQTTNSDIEVNESGNNNTQDTSGREDHDFGVSSDDHELETKLSLRLYIRRSQKTLKVSLEADTKAGAILEFLCKNSYTVNSPSESISLSFHGGKKLLQPWQKLSDVGLKDDDIVMVDEFAESNESDAGSWTGGHSDNDSGSAYEEEGGDSEDEHSMDGTTYDSNSDFNDNKEDDDARPKRKRQTTGRGTDDSDGSDGSDGSDVEPTPKKRTSNDPSANRLARYRKVVPKKASKKVPMQGKRKAGTPALKGVHQLDARVREKMMSSCVNATRAQLMSYPLARQNNYKPPDNPAEEDPARVNERDGDLFPLVSFGNYCYTEMMPNRKGVSKAKRLEEPELHIYTGSKHASEELKKKMMKAKVIFHWHHDSFLGSLSSEDFTVGKPVETKKRSATNDDKRKKKKRKN